MSSGEEVKNSFYSVRTPEELTGWLSSEFLYTLRLPDEPQAIEDTLRSRSGDCDDFALLASKALTRMGISNKILVLKFRDLKIKHAVCAFKDKNDLYSFISTRELFRTREDTLQGAIKKFYPDCEKIIKRSPRIYSRL